jgi:hypothetical protein
MALQLGAREWMILFVYPDVAPGANATMEDEAWHAGLRQVFLTQKELCQEGRSLVPPRRFERLHRDWANSLALYESAADDWLDALQYERFGPLVAPARDKYEDANPEFLATIVEIEETLKAGFPDEGRDRGEPRGSATSTAVTSNDRPPGDAASGEVGYAATVEAQLANTSFDGNERAAIKAVLVNAPPGQDRSPRGKWLSALLGIAQGASCGFLLDGWVVQQSGLQWEVSLVWTTRGERYQATWIYRPAENDVRAGNEHARRLDNPHDAFLFGCLDF